MIDRFAPRALFAVLIAMISPCVLSAAAPEHLKIEPNARIVLMGNGLGSRMLHFGYFETGMYLRYPQAKLFIRNMCDEGNTPSFRPHSGRADQLGFPGAEPFTRQYTGGNTANGVGHFETEEQWLARLKPDIIIAFFGFNESFQGSAGLNNYHAELDAFVKHTLSQKYNGESTPQLVLVSPTAIQDITKMPGAPDVPDGKKENSNLAAYTSVMEAVAKDNNVLFVDALSPSIKWYSETDKPLTIDGALMNDAGYRRFSELLIDRTFGKTEPPSTQYQDAVAAAVKEKNWMWLKDFKIPNGVHVFGRRYNPFGPQNYPFEINKIREMTDIRDQAIWAAATGNTLDVAALDAKTSTLPPVPTNYKPGGKNGELTFLTGKEALDTITVPEGYKIEQWATEQEFPDLANPVQMSFDNKGRLWVAVMPIYPHWKPGDPKPNDKILIFEDTDNDGKADKETVWADGLHLPMGFEISHDGVYVSQGINLVRLRDTNGDDHADTQEIIMSGFDDHDTHHAIGAYCADPSGAFIMSEGTFLRTDVETAYGPVRGTDGGFYRYAPQTHKLERHAQLPIPNPWGVAYDDWGQHFFLYTSSPNAEWMVPGTVKSMYGSANPRSEDLVEPAHRVRPTAGLEFVSSRNFPDEVQGDMLINNNIGFRGTKQHQVMDDGTGYKTKWRQDLTVSSDGNFRPVDLEFAPDGSLFIVDWHNPLIGHMQHNARDPNRDHAHGRIYRIYYTGRPLVTPAKIDGASIEQLLDNLKLPEYRTRYRTRRELRGRDADAVCAAVTKWVAGLDKNDPRYEHHRLEALWVTWGMDRVDQTLLRELLESQDYRARAAAVEVLRYTGHQVKDQVALLKKAAQDPQGRVKLEAIVAASWLDKTDGLAVLDAAVAAVTGAKEKQDDQQQDAVKINGLQIDVTPAFNGEKVTNLMISLPGKNRTINLMEMEILAGGRNIAGDAKVTSDSEYHSGEYPIKNLTDGNKASMSHSKDGTSNPWIKAAFDAPVALDGLRIWNRGGFEDRFNDAKIEFFNGKKKVASVQVKISGNSGGKDSPFAYDSWIDPPFKTALAHLNNQAIKEKVVINVPAHLKGEARKLYTQGAEIYAREGFCITCHQPDGNGLSAAGFPPLAGSRWVHGSDERIIKIALNGVFGPIEVKGAKYPGLVPMTPFAGMLKDDEIAAVLTYVRNSFGNKGPMVDPAKVKEVRDATKEKVGFYAPDELLKMHPLE